MKPRNTDLTFTLGEIKGANICLATQTTMSAFRELEMAGWHHWLDGRESGWTPGVGDGQGGLACCDSWGRKELDTTERLNWTELNWTECSHKYWSQQRNSWLPVICPEAKLFAGGSLFWYCPFLFPFCTTGKTNGDARLSLWIHQWLGFSGCNLV